LNCSVSTGFGATDDGMGVITILQLIRFFTTPGNEPKRGIVAMLNNGEEDFLNGDSSANLISSKI
jgi:Zn-dependent M28 family amino/carboxypeptidase